MAHADLLSRNPISNNIKEKSEPSVVNFAELHNDRIHVEQQRDPEILDFKTKLRFEELPEGLAQTYDIRKGVLYRKVERRKVTSWLPIIPRSLVWSLIIHVHCELKHLCFEKTLDKIYQLYWFPNMHK